MPIEMVSFPGPMLELAKLIDDAKGAGAAPEPSAASAMLAAIDDPKKKKGKDKKGKAAAAAQPEPSVAVASKPTLPQELVERALADVNARAAYGRLDVRNALTKEGVSFDWKGGKFNTPMDQDKLWALCDSVITPFVRTAPHRTAPHRTAPPHRRIAHHRTPHAPLPRPSGGGPSGGGGGPADLL